MSEPDEPTPTRGEKVDERSPARAFLDDDAELMAQIRSVSGPRPLDVLVDRWERLNVLDMLLRAGELKLDGEYAVFVHEDVPDYVEYYFKGLLPWRHLLTSEGRSSRKVVKAIRAEW